MEFATRRRDASARPPSDWRSLSGWALFGTGVLGAAVAFVVVPGDARSAAAQDWPPFVLVAGLLLIGLAAEQDGLFAAAGHWLAGTARSGAVLYLGATLLITLVTATLNLDTSVAFLTPVLVHTARSRKESEMPLLVACLLLSNAGSLFLPGSNLTNLIVLGHVGITGGEFFARMWMPAMTAVVVTAGVIAFFHRDHLSASSERTAVPQGATVGVGLAATVAATVVVVALRSPAIPVAVIGVVAVGTRVVRGKQRARRAVDVLGVPVLVGLFGIAVALGALGRGWDGPATLLGHLDPFGTAVIGAVTSVVVNNLPAASLLAARPIPQPLALLIGLNLGPNLFVTGSLAWFLWLRAARAAGAHPSISQAARVGAVAVPLALVAATGMLVVAGYR